MMRSFKLLPGVVIAALLSTLASAGTITGAVKNGTTGKPSAGNVVVLLRLGQGMEEAARAKTDASGRFTLNFPDDNSPHLVRVTHQDVNYHRPAPPGATSVEVEVFDAAPKLEGISATVHIAQMSAAKGTLSVTELYAVKNASQPRRTLMAPQTFHLELPPGAQLDGGLAAGPGGMPVNSAPVPDEKQTGRYYFVFPLRPGETRFQLSYHLPYSGEASFAPRALYPMEHYVVRLPKSMTFTAADDSKFQPMQEGGSTTMVATGVNAGETLAFKISGTGEFPREAAEAESGADAAGGAPRPGGGLGAPIDSPDPLRKYRWYILGGLAVALVAGAFYALSRPRQPIAGAPVSAGTTPSPSSSGNSRGRQSVLLEALKEELFQLEVDRQQGRISPEEYERAKSALDVTIARALKRNS